MKFIISFFILFNLIFSLAFSFENQNTITYQTIGFQTNSLSASRYEHQIGVLSENQFSFGAQSQLKISPILSAEQNSLDTKPMYDLDAKELLLNYSGARYNVEIGYLNLKKEGPDIFDIWGHFQPKNYKSLLNITTLPVLGISIDSELSKSLTLTTAFVPENRLSKIPNKNSMWLPRENKLPLASDDTVAELPANPSYEIEANQAEKKQDLQNNFLIRLKYSGSQMDAVIQISESISNTPIITPTLTGQLISINPTKIQLDNPILLDLKWKKNKNYGIGVSYSFNEIGVIAKLFSNYTLTPDHESLQTVLAIEKQFENLVAVYEYTHTTKKDNLSSNALATANSLFSNAHATALLYSLGDNIKLKMGGFLNTDMAGYAVLIGGKYQINDSWSSEIQYLTISGNPDSVLGLYENNDAASLKLTTQF